ncbi:hypothetical protein [Mucilaginibacter sp.]|uniref:hypothetical protein n=1 Tax=Mucilaginibacter sp. TaxID=1882438 RepID=UPI0025F47371|nr:hypothetical protein [Mucilaginibacter sp.]
MEKINKIEDLYLNSLLKISDQDEETTQKLLENEGIDGVSIVNKTLKNIENYKFALMEKIAANQEQQLMGIIMGKIDTLMQKVPERITALINSFVQPHAPAFRFKSASYSEDISEVFGLIDPLLLLDQLTAIEQELK